MKKFIIRVTAAVMCLHLCTLFPTHAESGRKIVILGDSISAGTGLSSEEKNYVDLIKQATHAQIQNFSQPNADTAAVLTALDDPEIQNALANADDIIITAGLYDIMNPFMNTASGFMTQFGFTRFIDVFTANLQDYGIEDENELVRFSNALSDAAAVNLESAQANTKAITEKLSQYNNAKIIYQSVYNLLDNIDIYDSLSVKRKKAYDSVRNPLKAVLNEAINDPLHEWADLHENVILADIYTEFQGNAWQYTGLYDMEMNPTAKGHAKIAEIILKQAELPQMGDVNHDNNINALDAALVLRHATLSGSGLGDLLTEEQKFYANVDENTFINSQDAAQILSYATAQGSGQSYYFRPASSKPETAQAGNNPEIIDPDPDQPGDVLTDPDPDQPGDILTDPDPDQPGDILTDPDPDQPGDILTDPDPDQPGDILTDPDPDQPGDVLTDPDPDQPGDILTDPDQPGDILTDPDPDQPE